MDPVDYFCGFRIRLSTYHYPSLSITPRLSNIVRPVSVCSTLPLGAYIRSLSLRDEHGVFIKSHLRVSKFLFL